MNPKKPIEPFGREAYQDREYNERNGYTRRDYEEHAAWDVDDFDQWLEHEGIPDDNEPAP